MADFVKGGAVKTPFGRNEFLRSWQDIKTEGYTFAASTLPAVTIDGHPGQKVLQPGTVLAKITSGPEAGKVGAFSAAATDGREELANIVGLCLTFAPWQLVERDIEVSAVYECSAIQAWCREYDGTSAVIPLTNTTAAAMQRGGAAGKGVDVTFK